jgi:hypothetical protein
LAESGRGSSLFTFARCGCPATAGLMREAVHGTTFVHITFIPSATQPQSSVPISTTHYQIPSWRSVGETSHVSSPAPENESRLFDTLVGSDRQSGSCIPDGPHLPACSARPSRNCSYLSDEELLLWIPATLSVPCFTSRGRHPCLSPGAHSKLQMSR